MPPRTTTTRAARPHSFHYLSPEECIALARAYHTELRALADRMDAVSESMYDRGRWHEATWLLRKDACDRLVSFIGEKTLEIPLEMVPDEAHADEHGDEHEEGAARAD